MSDVQKFEAARGLASACSTGSVIEVFEGKDGTYLLMFTVAGGQGKTVLRLSTEAFARLVAIGLRLFKPPEAKPVEVQP